MELRWHGEQVLSQLSTWEDRFLNQVGADVAREAAGNWRVRTGRGRASVHYLTSADLTGPASVNTGGAGPVSPPETPKTVRIGSALFYALPYEKRQGWLSRAIDSSRRGFAETARAVGREVFG